MKKNENQISSSSWNENPIRNLRLRRDSIFGRNDSRSKKLFKLKHRRRTYECSKESYLRILTLLIEKKSNYQKQLLQRSPLWLSLILSQIEMKVKRSEYSSRKEKFRMQFEFPEWRGSDQQEDRIGKIVFRHFSNQWARIRFLLTKVQAKMFLLSFKLSKCLRPLLHKLFPQLKNQSKMWKVSKSS